MSASYTVHELSDLAKAWAYEVGQISKSVDCARTKGWTFSGTPMATLTVRNPQGVDAWLDAWDNAYANFGNVLDRANALINDVQNNPVLSWDVYAATDTQGDVFSAMLDAVAPFDDLDRQLRMQGNPLDFPVGCLPQYPNVPQPTAPDFALDFYNRLGAVTKYLEKDVMPTGERIILALLSIGVLIAIAKR